MIDCFALLDQPRAPWLDLDELKEAYHKKTLRAHPDAQANRTDETDASFASLNEAYQVLQDPKRRLHHLLSLQGCAPSSAGSVSQSRRADPTGESSPWKNSGDIKRVKPVALEAADPRGAKRGERSARRNSGFIRCCARSTAPDQFSLGRKSGRTGRRFVEALFRLRLFNALVQSARRNYISVIASLRDHDEGVVFI
jgi:curved DNA-binding protein CbpA